MSPGNDARSRRRRRALDREWARARAEVAGGPRPIAGLVEVLDDFGRPGPCRLDCATAAMIGRLARLALAEICLEVPGALEPRPSPTAIGQVAGPGQAIIDSAILSITEGR